MDQFEPSAANVDPWEQAYLRFETPSQEINKFKSRLRHVGALAWPKDSKIVELFCGRGNGLIALQQLGFNNLLGVDLSPKLLAQYPGPANKTWLEQTAQPIPSLPTLPAQPANSPALFTARPTLYCADRRALPIQDASIDVAIVQGGLHHLPRIPFDLDRTLAETARILRPKGIFIAIEPWQTPFLSIVHIVSRQTLVRRLWPKMDAFAAMVENEQKTYDNWLSRPAEIEDLLRKHFEVDLMRQAWGKLTFQGNKPPPKTTH